MNTPDLSRSAWRKSTHSGSGGQCVEVSTADDVIGLRDSKNPTGPILTLTSHQWTALLTRLRSTP